MLFLLQPCCSIITDPGGYPMIVHFYSGHLQRQSVSQLILQQVLYYLTVCTEVYYWQCSCRMYLSILQIIFAQIINYICPNYKLHLSNYRLYLSKLLIVFVQIINNICQNYKLYLSKL